jgi:U3 small nucleolar RNA-associated protein 20
LPLAIQLHNDESSKCKKLAWLALKSLLEKVSVEQRDALFGILTALFEENDKALYKRIAALVVKIFVEVENSQFERRLDTILNILSKELDIKNFEKV